jgi:RNA polymerase sigma factor (sigma-70 family)
MNASCSTVLAFHEPPNFPEVSLSSLVLTQEKKSIHSYTDQDIIIGLKARDESVIKYLYIRYYDQIKYMVISNSGSEMDAEDTFQDSLLALYKKVSREDLRLTSTFFTYFYSICRHLWLQKINKRCFKYEVREITDQDTLGEQLKYGENDEESEKFSLFQKHFKMLTLDEQKVLKLYIGKTPGKEVAKIMGYKSDKYAKFRKYVCKEKLKNSIINDPLFKALFSDN